jgi:hypothetical protein
MSSEFVGRSFKALRQKNCFLGFDAFIDYITKPIVTGKGETARHFGSIEDYAKFLQEHKNKSFSIELEPPRVKIGGNNPIMSRILSRCGVQVVTAGPYGIPRPNPLFQPILEQCKVISFSDPGICTAYEFSINKIMNYYNMNTDDFSYEHLLKYVSEEELVSIFDMMDLVVFVNIGEQPAVLNILEAIEERVLPKLCGQKIFFIDFSDCTHMTIAELQRGISFLGRLGRFGKTVLSVNEHEFQIFWRHIKDASFLEYKLPDSLRYCRERLSVDSLILRTLHFFFCSSEEEELSVNNSVVENPVCITGVGDAQNAGICLGILEGYSMKESLETGVWAGNVYLNTGIV